MLKIRIKFSKHGAFRFIGHLDIMRYFQKAFRRAEIDIAYSEGFSPHQIMAFSAPLGIGLESDGEYMDVVLNSCISLSDLKSRLNAQMAEGIEILSAKYLAEKTANAMASVAAAGYYVFLRDHFTPEMGWKSAIEAFLAQEKIPVVKKTQKNEFEIDMKQFIFDFHVSSYQGEDCFYMMVNASSSGNMKPVLVLTELYGYLGLTFDASNLHITKEDTYLNLGTEEVPEYAPLDAIGMDEIGMDEK